MNWIDYKSKWNLRTGINNFWKAAEFGLVGYGWWKSTTL